MASKNTGPRSQPVAKSPRNKVDQAAVEVVARSGADGFKDEIEQATSQFTDTGLTVSGDAFGFVSTGSIESIGDAIRDLVVATMNNDAASVRIHITRTESELAVAPLHDALDSMVRAAERVIGKPPLEWSREEKQAVVGQLDDQGAFLLRGAVDDLARILGVSRITIYNYLNAIDRG